MQLDLVIKNISVLATAKGKSVQRGIEQGNIETRENMAIGILDKKIAYIGKEQEAPIGAKEIDAGGRLVTPGLVDAHTHLVFGGYRQNELERKLRGDSYLDILRSGGGILSTVNSTRAAGFEELQTKAESFLDKMLAHGTTTVEAKSGYGLDMETEIKQLQVVKALNESHKMDIVSTFMGAHAIPNEYKDNPEGFVDFIINEMIPHVAKEKLAKYCDIFCETAVFDVSQSRRILTAAKEQGFKVKIHADEIDPIGGASLAGELQCISAEHLIAAPDEGLDELAKNGVIAVLLPATSHYLNKDYARAKEMIKRGIPIAVASDFNPGSSPNFNLQVAMSLSCLKYKLTPKEALMAVTLNGACAIEMQETKGTIEIGKDADIVIWDCPDLNFLFYRFGNNQVHTVIKNGRIVL
ncbi:MAG: imidazolonepropionase [Defluviitaleaceae bacterium]|nr:imidazolonepropionase [Defluviitaleaceae bacterium]